MGNARPSPRATLHRLPVAFLGAVGAGASTASLYRLLARRLPLGLVIGNRLPVLAVALSISALACAWLCAREIAAARRRQPREKPFAFLRVAFVAVISTWLGFLALVHPAEKLWMEAAAGIGSGAFGVGMLLETPLRQVPARLRRAADLVLFTLCASAFLLELSLRTAAALHPTQLLARFGDLPEEVIRRMHKKPGEVYLGFACNSTGHYDDEFVKREPGKRLVVTIGDSFSIGIVPHAYHFTTVCERILGSPVDNMGIAATGPPEYLRLLVDEALPLDPDLVVIDVFVGNDLVLGERGPDRTATLARGWLDRNSVLLWLVPERLSRMAEERRNLRGRSSIGEAPGADSSRGILEDPAMTLRSLPWLVDPMLEGGSFTASNYRWCETFRARQNCTAGPEELANFYASMRAMKDAAGPTPICVMLIPDEFQVEEDVWNDVLQDTNGANLDRDHPQKILLPWFAENGFEVLDLLPILRGAPPLPDGRRHLYHLRDTHFNARGNRLTGEALAEFVRERLARIPKR